MEVISRSEAYLNYALKNQETYPKPISRIDYYLLSLAQEVRAGGADPATITTAVNDYLAANPVQAMSDEQVATSVNKGIANDSIDVVAGIKDGSVTKAMLSPYIQSQRYRINANCSWVAIQGALKDYININSDNKITLKFKIKPLANINYTTEVRIKTTTNGSGKTIGTTSTMKTGEYYDYSFDYTPTKTETLTGFMFQRQSGAVTNMYIEILDIKLIIDGTQVDNSQLTINSNDTAQTLELLTDENISLSDTNMVIESLEEAKEYTNNKFDNISSNIAEDSIELDKLKETYPLDKSMANTYINKIVKEMKIFGEYKTSQTNKSTTLEEKNSSPVTYWFNTFENIKDSRNINNIKMVLENSKGEKWEFKHGVGDLGSIGYREIMFYDNSHRLRATIWIDDWKLFSTTKFTSEYQILEGTGNKDNALIDKRCIIPTYRNIKEKFDLPMPDRLYAVATINKEARYALPVYLDYVQGYFGMYKDTKDSILFKGGSDVKYIAPSPKNENKNLYIYSKNFKFESEKYLVDDKKVKLVSTGISQKIKEPLRILTIGDSVTAGAITQQQYWSFAGDYFAKEDLITDRDSKVMFLGTNNYRDTTVTYGEKTKQVHTCACGISSWSLNTWLTTDNDGKVNGFTYTDDEGNVQFSFLKWLERYRNYDDEGNKLSIGDSNLGTMVTENNIDKIQCCTPNIILINSTHNGGSIEEHLKIAEIARKEIPNVKIIITDPMPLLGTWKMYNYVDRDWIEDGLEEPNYRAQGAYYSDRMTKSRYWSKYEQYNDDVYIFPITWITPTVEGWEWDEYKLGNSNKIIKRATTQPLPKEHPGTFTHSIWGYELYSLLKYIGIKDIDGLTSNEETITLDNTTLTINYGDTATLTATSNNSSSVLKYYSSDETIATVDEDTGVITPVSGGTCKIWVHGDYAIKPVYCTVTIQANVTGVEFADEETYIEIGESKTLSYSIIPSVATNQNVTFSVDNSNITITDEGIITGVTEGTSVVTITTEEGSFTDTITINVVSEILDVHNTLMANSSYWKQGEYASTDGKFTTGDGTRIAYQVPIKVDASTSYTLTTNNTSTKFVVRGLKSDGRFDTSFGAVNNGSSITTTSTTDTLVMTIYAPAGGKTSNELLQMIADGTIVPTITKVTK